MKKSANEINMELLEILVCPLCKGELKYDTQNQELLCKKSKLAYPIKNGIPIMLVEEARQVLSE